MEHDARMFEGITLSSSTGGEDYRAHGCSHAGADCRDFAGDVLHGVVHAEAAVYRAAGGVDVYLYVLRRVSGLEEEELCLDYVGDFVRQFSAYENDSVGDEPREYIHLAERSVTLLDYGACHVHDVARVLVESVAADATVVDCIFPKFVVVYHGDMVVFGKIYVVKSNVFKAFCQP